MAKFSAWGIIRDDGSLHGSRKCCLAFLHIWIGARNSGRGGVVHIKHHSGRRGTENGEIGTFVRSNLKYGFEGTLCVARSCKSIPSSRPDGDWKCDTLFPPHTKPEHQVESTLH